MPYKQDTTVETSLEELTTTNDQGLVKISLCGKVGEYETIEYNIDPFLDIDIYPRGQLSENKCVTTARNNIYVFNLTTQLLGGFGRFQ